MVDLHSNIFSMQHHKPHPTTPSLNPVKKRGGLRRGFFDRSPVRTAAWIIMFLISLIASAGFRPFGRGLRAVQDRVAAIEAERVLAIIEAFARRLVARIDQSSDRPAAAGGPR